MSATQADLDTAIQGLGTLITNDDALITQLMTLVQSIIAKVGTTVDLTNEVTALQSIQASVNTQAGNISTVIENLKTAGA